MFCQAELAIFVEGSQALAVGKNHSCQSTAEYGLPARGDAKHSQADNSIVAQIAKNVNTKNIKSMKNRAFWADFWVLRLISGGLGRIPGWKML